jgi:hypothetical protein
LFHAIAAPAKIKGGLLPIHEAALAGGDSGPAVAPGNPEEFSCSSDFSYNTEEPQMPRQEAVKSRSR